jgi:hypothetical protein
MGARGDMVEEQRARLPPPVDPARCGDTIEGVWVSHSWDPRWHEWSIFTLDVRRKQGSADAFEGTLTNRSWDGTPDEPEPPATCTPGVKHWTVWQYVEGRTHPDGRIEVHARSWRIERVYCDRWATYNLDHLSGSIDPELQEFQSVNNDGDRAVNDPVVFRRVRCPDASPRQPHVDVSPPPFYPARASRGLCAVGW